MFKNKLHSVTDQFFALPDPIAVGLKTSL